jgi:hypothetical protein
MTCETGGTIRLLYRSRASAAVLLFVGPVENPLHHDRQQLGHNLRIGFLSATQARQFK